MIANLTDEISSCLPHLRAVARILAQDRTLSAGFSATPEAAIERQSGSPTAGILSFCQLL